MAKKGQAVQLQTEVNSDEEWEKLLEKDGLIGLYPGVLSAPGPSKLAIFFSCGHIFRMVRSLFRDDSDSEKTQARYWGRLATVSNCREQTLLLSLSLRAFYFRLSVTILRLWRGLEIRVNLHGCLFR